MFRIFLGLIAICLVSGAAAQNNRIDTVREDAPLLAHFGPHEVGVRTIEFVDKERPDIVNTLAGEAIRFYDRSLTVEVWYPAQLSENERPGTEYETATRNLSVTATLTGRAVRNANGLHDNQPSPLIIVSHGYPGNRYLMSHMGENLASKGYVVVAVDHRDSTYTDQQSITSSLYNRPLDQLFVIDQIEQLAADPASFLGGRVDTENTAIIGYSVGGYGLLVNLGAGYSDTIVNHELAPPNDLAQLHAESNPAFGNAIDPRIKAAFAIAPWGMEAGVWNATALANITVPTFFLAGSKDTTAGYENGVRTIFEALTNSDRFLLTFTNAGHNAGAPIPLPIELRASLDKTGTDHYTDPVWNTVLMNNINNHFATAFFDHVLKDDPTALPYLQLIASSNDGDWNAGTYWKGFEKGTARSLRLEHHEAAE